MAIRGIVADTPHYQGGQHAALVASRGGQDLAPPDFRDFPADIAAQPCAARSAGPEASPKVSHGAVCRRGRSGHRQVSVDSL